MTREQRHQRALALVRGGLRTADHRLRFDVKDKQAARWAAKYAAELVQDVNEQTLAALRRYLSRVFTEGISPAKAAQTIRAMVGLSDRQAQAVLAVRDAIENGAGRKVWAGKVAVRVPAGGASKEFIDRVARQYASRLRRQRALMIARTETLAASNEGQRLLWRQAQADGLLGPDATREWIANPGACDTCRQKLNGQRRGLDEPFDGGTYGAVMAPPAHPNCRCSQGLASTGTIGQREAA